MNKQSLPLSERQLASSAGWMITFADLLSLLLTFFVLLFSMSTVKNEDWDHVVKTMRNQFNPSTPIVERSVEVDNMAAVESGLGLNLNYLQGLLSSAVSHSPALSDANIYIEADKVVVSIPASQLFGNKTSVFNVGASEALTQLSSVLMQIDNKLVVSGHTNDLPMPSGSMRSNWELSVIRARLVAGVLAEGGYQRSLVVVGHGASKFAASSDRVSVNELELQERVDLVLLPEGRQKGAFDVF